VLEGRGGGVIGGLLQGQSRRIGRGLGQKKKKMEMLCQKRIGGMSELG